MLRVVYPRVHRRAQPIALKTPVIVPRLTSDALTGHEFEGQVEQAGPDQKQQEPRAEFTGEDAVQHHVPDPGDEGVQAHSLACGHQDVLVVSISVRIILLTSCQARKPLFIVIEENRYGTL